MKQFLLFVSAFFILSQAANALPCYTADIHISGNLNSSEAIIDEESVSGTWWETYSDLEERAHYIIPTQIYDPAGDPHTVHLYFFRIGELEWRFLVIIDGGEFGGAAGTPVALGEARDILFRSDGSRDTQGFSDFNEFLVWPDGSISDAGMAIFLTDLTLRESPYRVENITVDGHQPPCRTLANLDFDGDSVDDLAIFRPESGMWAVQLSGGTPPNNYLWVQWGLPGDVPISGDYTGDNLADLVVWRPSNGTWYICMSDHGFICTAPLIEQWGLIGDRPIQADYNGDGVLDFVVWRPSEGMFYSKTSTLFTPVVNARQWGLPSDIPLATHPSE